VIWDSTIWKRDLLKIAESLKKAIRRKEPSERLLADVEKWIFVGFYIVRKLVEARKISLKTEKRILVGRKYPAKRKNVTLLNWDIIDELYDLSNAMRDEMNLQFICNQIIHSYVFTYTMTGKDNHLQGIMFSSDWERSKSLHELRLSQVIRLFEVVGHDYVSRTEIVCGANGKTDVLNYQGTNIRYTRPDIDLLIKSILNGARRGGLFQDLGQVVRVSARKVNNVRKKRPIPGTQ
jgi:hypothetical protein